MKQPAELTTAFDTYVVGAVIGEGGAGRVYAATDSDGNQVAIKELTSSSTEKKKRFKNEIKFLAGNKHQNIVSAIEYGFGLVGNKPAPFYVMRRYEGSLRAILMPSLKPQMAMQLFGQILDGVEAAHLLGVTHRDLKPENILLDEQGTRAAVSDFGVASFTQDMVQTLVETAPGTRLANFQYAAPEQRRSGQTIRQTADIYALGLILNELFTKNVPHGTEHQKIRSVAPEFGFLDEVIDQMLRQDPNARPDSIAAVKGLIERHRSEFITRQKLSEISQQVIPIGDVDDPLALTPPRLVDANWTNGTLTLVLDRPVHQGWVDALHNMGGHTSVLGLGPERFNLAGFKPNEFRVPVQEQSAQSAIDFFKQWLPRASQVLRETIKRNIEVQEQQMREQLRREKAAQELNLRVNSSLRI